MNPILLLDFAGVAVFAATGALAASRKQLDVIGFIFLAAVLGTMNVVGGYVVTDRMLEMFKSDKSKKSADKNEEAK